MTKKAATGFMRDRKFDEEQEQHERGFEEAQRRSKNEAIARRLAADEAEGIFT
ncbi:MAG: hypothetical protein GY814_19545 [Gammaproteobacteria bacterium]|nr:hypothetical protein [Gammaproteobacteria bacterium]